MRGETNSSAGVFGETTDDLASQSEWAAFVYSLVPFLGVLFVPVAFVISLVKVLTATHPRGRQRSLYFLLAAAASFGMQFLLWWLLYVVPELQRGI